MGLFNPAHYIKQCSDTDLSILLRKEDLLKEFTEFVEFFDEEEIATLSLISLSTGLPKVTSEANIELNDRSMKIALCTFNLLPAHACHQSRQSLAVKLLPHLIRTTDQISAQLERWSENLYTVKLGEKFRLVLAVQDTLHECLRLQRDKVSVQDYIRLKAVKHKLVAYMNGHFNKQAFDDELFEVSSELIHLNKQNAAKVNEAIKQYKQVDSALLEAPSGPLKQLHEGLNVFVDTLMNQERLEQNDLFTQTINQNKGLISQFESYFKTLKIIDIQAVTKIKLALSIASHALDNPQYWSMDDMKELYKLFLRMQMAIKLNNQPILFCIYIRLSIVVSEIKKRIKNKKIVFPIEVSHFLSKGDSIVFEELNLEEQFVLAPYLRLNKDTEAAGYIVRDKIEDLRNQVPFNEYYNVYINKAFDYIDYRVQRLDQPLHITPLVLQDMIQWAIFWLTSFEKNTSIHAFDFEMFVSWMIVHLPKDLRADLNQIYFMIKDHTQLATKLITIIQEQDLESQASERWANRVSVSKVIKLTLEACIKEHAKELSERETLFDLLLDFKDQLPRVEKLDGPDLFDQTLEFFLETTLNHLAMELENQVLKESIEKLTQDNAALTSELAERPTQKQLEKEKNKFKSIQTSLQHKELKIQNSKKLNGHLENKLKSFKEQIQSLEQHLNSLEQQNKLLNVSLKSKEQALEQLEKTQRELNKVTTKLDTLKSSHQDIISKSTEAEAHQQELEATVNELLKQLDTARIRVAVESSKAENLQSELDDLESAFADLHLNINQTGAQDAQIPNQPVLALTEARPKSPAPDIFRLKRKIKLTPDIIEHLKLLEGDNQYHAFVQGGWIRSGLTKTLAHDVDIITTCPREVIEKLDGFKENPHRPNHFFNRALKVDIKCYDDLNLEEIAQQSDITLNALFADKYGHLYDPLKIIGDFKDKKLKALGDMHETWEADPAKMLRLIRFCCELNWSLSDEQIEALCEHLRGIHKRMPFGVYVTNLKKLFATNPQQTFEFLVHSELLSDVMCLPALKLKSRKHPNIHFFWDETIKTCKPTHQSLTALFMYLDVLCELDKTDDFEKACAHAINAYLKRWSQPPEQQTSLTEGLMYQLKCYHQKYQKFNLPVMHYAPYLPQYALAAQDSQVLDQVTWPSIGKANTQKHHKH